MTPKKVQSFTQRGFLSILHHWRIWVHHIPSNRRTWVNPIIVLRMNSNKSWRIWRAHSGWAKSNSWGLTLPSRCWRRDEGKAVKGRSSCTTLRPFNSSHNFLPQETPAAACHMEAKSRAILEPRGLWTWSAHFCSRWTIQGGEVRRRTCCLLRRPQVSHQLLLCLLQTGWGSGDDRESMRLRCPSIRNLFRPTDFDLTLCWTMTMQFWSHPCPYKGTTASPLRLHSEPALLTGLQPFHSCLGRPVRWMLQGTP